MVFLDDVFSQLGVGFNQRIHRVHDLLFDQAAHFKDLGANGFQFGIVLFVYVFR